MVIAYVDGKCLDVDILRDRNLEIQPDKKSKSDKQARSVILVRFLAWIEHVSQTLARKRWETTYMS